MEDVVGFSLVVVLIGLVIVGDALLVLLTGCVVVEADEVGGCVEVAFVLELVGVVVSLTSVED